MSIKTKAIEMVKNGASYSGAGVKLGAMPATVRKWCLEAGVISTKKGGRNGKTFSAKIKKQAVALFPKMTISEIAKKYGASWQAVNNWIRESSKNDEKEEKLKVKKETSNKCVWLKACGGDKYTCAFPKCIEGRECIETLPKKNQ